MWRGYNIYSKYKVINIFCKEHFCTHSAAGAGGDALKTQPGKTKSIHIIYLQCRYNEVHQALILKKPKPFYQSHCFITRDYQEQDCQSNGATAVKKHLNKVYR